jgi:hypothetical protein
MSAPHSREQARETSNAIKAIRLESTDDPVKTGAHKPHDTVPKPGITFEPDNGSSNRKGSRPKH